MEITHLVFKEGVLGVTCGGEYGVGSEGQPSADLLKSTIERWFEGHPGQSVAQIDVDYTDVDYSWGDGPVSSVIGFCKQGVSKIRLIAGQNNLDSLEGLVESKRCQAPNC